MSSDETVNSVKMELQEDMKNNEKATTSSAVQGNTVGYTVGSQKSKFGFSHLQFLILTCKCLSLVVWVTRDEQSFYKPT